MPSVRETTTEMYFSGLLGRDEEPPDIFVNTIGTCRSYGRFRYRLRSAGFHMRFMISGDGFGDSQGRRLRIARNDFYLYWPGAAVDLHDVPDSPWHFVWLGLAGKNLPWAIQRSGFSTGSAVYHLGENNDLIPLALEIFERFKRGNFHPVYPMHAAWQLLWSTASKLGLQPDMSKSLDLASTCRSFICASKGAVHATDLARHLKISRSTLFRLFAEQYAMSPKDYIEQIHFEKACHLLSNTKLTVREIARRCHYEDAEYFARRFRLKLNHNPMEWRRSYSDPAPIS